MRVDRGLSGIVVLAFKSHSTPMGRGKYKPQNTNVDEATSHFEARLLDEAFEKYDLKTP